LDKIVVNWNLQITNFMISKKILFALFLIASLGSEVIAQTRLSYGDTTGSFMDFPTNLATRNSQGDSGVIIGYGERFDLPPGKHILDSVDFILDSIGADSSIIDIVPVMTFVSSNGPELLPDFSDFHAIKRIYTSTKFVAGSRTTVSCGKINVENPFFVFLVSNHGSNKYRASKQTIAVALDTVRAAVVALDTKPPASIFTELVDGNLVPSGVNIDMDIGITYENADGVQVHLSPSTSPAIAFPNPATSGNPVSVSGTGPFVSAEITDDVGRIMRTLHGDSGTSTTQLPTQGLPAGVYNVILFRSDGSSSSVKFVIE
jgi:hypothetical protein